MKKQYKQEIRYLYSLINSVEYPSNAFTIIQSDGKYIFGITSAPGQESPLSKILEYKTISDTLCDLDEKVKLSLKMAIKSSYSHYVKKAKGKRTACILLYRKCRFSHLEYVGCACSTL